MTEVPDFWGVQEDVYCAVSTSGVLKLPSPHAVEEALLKYV